MQHITWYNLKSHIYIYPYGYSLRQKQWRIIYRFKPLQNGFKFMHIKIMDNKRIFNLCLISLNSILGQDIQMLLHCPIR